MIDAGKNRERRREKKWVGVLRYDAAVDWWDLLHEAIYNMSLQYNRRIALGQKEEACLTRRCCLLLLIKVIKR